MTNKGTSKDKETKRGKTKFYPFNQNNSGGYFIEDEEVCAYVLIEAHDAEEANRKAGGIGIYFDGCSNGQDCSCCGDRWSSVSEDEGTDEPEYYGEPIKEVYKQLFKDKCIIHYIGGRKERVIFKTFKDCPGHTWENKYNIGNQCTICGVWESGLTEEAEG